MEKLDSKKVLVIGDICLDVFVYCECNRICPEAAVPILNELKQVKSWGMAGNVASNLISLGVTTDLMIPDTNSKICKKTRYINEKTNTMFFRIDDDVQHTEICNIKTLDYSQYDAIVISDYNKGFLDHNVINRICINHKSVFVDTKKQVSNWATPLYFKINETEWKNSNYYESENIIVTLGSRGCYFNKQYYNTTKHDSFDVSGAGDTFLASLVACYISEQPIETCLKVANLVSADIVLKKGVATPDFKIWEYIEKLKD